MTRKTIISITQSLFIILIGLALLFADAARQANAVRPPPGVTDLSTFLKTMPPPKEVRTFTQNNATFIQVIGPSPNWWLVPPSGPPAYVFDARGQLIDWCRDTGDNSAFNRKWSNSVNATSLSSEEALRLSEAGQTAITKGMDFNGAKKLLEEQPGLKVEDYYGDTQGPQGEGVSGVVVYSPESADALYLLSLDRVGRTATVDSLYWHLDYATDAVRPKALKQRRQERVESVTVSDIQQRLSVRSSKSE